MIQECVEVLDDLFDSDQDDYKNIKYKSLRTKSNIISPILFVLLSIYLFPNFYIFNLLFSEMIKSTEFGIVIYLINLLAIPIHLRAMKNIWNSFKNFRISKKQEKEEFDGKAYLNGDNLILKFSPLKENLQISLADCGQFIVLNDNSLTPLTFDYDGKSLIELKIGAYKTRIFHHGECTEIIFTINNNDILKSRLQNAKYIETNIYNVLTSTIKKYKFQYIKENK